jgi:hypothetical protein
MLFFFLMEPTQFDFIFGFYAKLGIKSTQAAPTHLPSFPISGASLTRIPNCRGKINTFQIAAHKVK